MGYIIKMLGRAVMCLLHLIKPTIAIYIHTCMYIVTSHTTEETYSILQLQALPVGFQKETPSDV